MGPKIEQVKAEKITQIRAEKIKQVPYHTPLKTQDVTAEDRGQVTELRWTKLSKRQMADKRKVPYILLIVWCLPLLFLQEDPNHTLFGYLALGVITTLVLGIQKSKESLEKYCPWCQSVNDVHALICRSCGRQPLPLQEGCDASRTTYHDYDASGDIRRGPNANHTQHRVRTGSIPIRFF